MIRTRLIIPPRNKYLWKYLDLYKFIQLIRSKELFFNSLNSFDDILEGISEDDAAGVLLDAYSANTAIVERNPEIPKDVYNDIGCNIVHWHEKQKLFQKVHFVSCFYNSNYESAAMWNLYSGIQGIAIRFKAKELYEYIHEYYKVHLNEDYSFSAKNLTYKDLLNLSPYDKNGEIANLSKLKSVFQKDKLYRHEQEYRFVFKTKNEPSNPIEPVVNLINFDFSNIGIFVPPHIEDWKFKLIKDLLSDYHMSISFSKSRILTQKELMKYRNIYLDTLLEKKELI